MQAIEEATGPFLENASPGWAARLALSFVSSGGATVMSRRRQQGPLAVQRAFFPEGRSVAHVYILHPPGGVVPGDTLEVDVDCAGHALLTTPAATKLYRSDGRQAKVTQALRVAPGAVLEWLPQETILFEGASADLATRIELCEGAAFLGWDLVCLGRPAAGEGFRSGRCRQQLELWLGPRPLVIERTCYDGAMQGAPWGMRGATVTGTLVAFPSTPDFDPGPALAELRGMNASGAFLSATSLDRVVVVRYLGHHLEQARALFESAWAILRPRIAGRPMCRPRVWST